MIILKFNKDETHTVYTNIDGNEVPSATTILKILNKPSLIRWANYLGFNRQNVESVLTDYADRGTLVHSLISAYLNGSLIIYIDDGKIPISMILQFFKVFKEWYKKHDIEMIFSEKSFSSDLFGGTIDFYGKIDGQYTLLDFKTAKKIRLSMFLQLALYCILLEEKNYKIDRVGILLVNPDNKDEKYLSREEMEPYIQFMKKLVPLFHLYYELNEKDKWNEEII